MPYPRSPLFVALSLAAAVAIGATSISGVPAPALSLGWYGDACDDALAQNPGDPDGCRYDAYERACGDGVDNDSDERADRADPDCGHGDPVCGRESAPNVGGVGGCDGLAPAHCGDGLDNDADGAYDCSDMDCDESPNCRACAAVVEVCGNGVDDDCDGLVDGEDQDCGCTTDWYNWWQPKCGCPATELDADGDCAPEAYWWGSACADGGDNDGDGLYDCADRADCAGDAACADGPAAEDCANTLDDDGDGAADCADSDCAGPQCGTACPPGKVPGITPSGTYNCVPAVEVCDNGADDDADYAADCSDSDCTDAPNCKGNTCNGASYCDPSCPEYNLCVCNPADPSCGGGGCTGSFCECNPSDPSCQGDVCGDRKCSGEEDCKTCESDCGKCPPKYEICGNGEDDDENGTTDCEDQACSGTCECTNDCGCTGDECNSTCDDVAACNYGEQESCNFCECDGADNDNDGTTDEEGEECGSTGGNGCSDPGATNYDPEAKSGEDRDEDCDYTYGCSATIDQPLVISSGNALAAAYAPWNLLARDGSENITGAEFQFRFSLSRKKGGGWTISLSPQVALTTLDGKYPMGAIQAGPSVTLSGSGLSPTPPYSTDDPIQAKIHQEIDKGFFGKWMAEKHSQLQRKCDVYNWFNKK